MGSSVRANTPQAAFVMWAIIPIPPARTCPSRSATLAVAPAPGEPPAASTPSDSVPVITSQRAIVDSTGTALESLAAADANPLDIHVVSQGDRNFHLANAEADSNCVLLRMMSWLNVQGAAGLIEDLFDAAEQLMNEAELASGGLPQAALITPLLGR